MRVSTAFLALCAFVTLGACGGSGGTSAGIPVVQSGPAPLLFALLVNTTDPQDPPNSAIEIVNLDTLQPVGGFVLSGVRGASLAVSPDGNRLYIADRQAGQILVRNRAGGVLGSIPLPGVHDIVLDATGTRLWAASLSGPKIARYDALTLAPAVSITPAGLGSGIALSPDGTKLAWVSYTGYGGAINGCYIANAQTLAAPVPVNFSAAPCNTAPSDARFVGNSRLVVWDSNCDRLHQIDANTNTLLLASEVALPLDAGASYNANNCLTSTASTARVYGFKESGHAFRVDPLIPASHVPTGNTGGPTLVALSPDEQSLFLFGFGTPIKLDRMSTSTETFTNDVYTFSSPLGIPRDAVTRTAVP